MEKNTTPSYLQYEWHQNHPFKQFPVVKIDDTNLWLRPLQLTDALAIYEYARSKNVTRYTLWPAHRNLADSINFVTTTIQNYTLKPNPEWAIVQNDLLIGTIGIHKWNAAHARCAVGYVLNLKFWRQGITTLALKAVLKYGFTHLHLHRIQATCNPNNIASWRVMEKCGMLFEGIKRGYYLRQSNFEDCRLYAILQPDWLKKNDGE